jgi:hypothetical protein
MNFLRTSYPSSRRADILSSLSITLIQLSNAGFYSTVFLSNSTEQSSFEKLTVAQIVKKFPPFMGPEGSLPCS